MKVRCNFRFCRDFNEVSFWRWLRAVVKHRSLRPWLCPRHHRCFTWAQVQRFRSVLRSQRKKYPWLKDV